MGPADSVIQKMKDLASSACEKAYCPYSRFPVGAAVLTDDGKIFAGCNVENASYGLTVCAERNAVFQAVAAGCRMIDAVVVVTHTDSLSTPCGACRQVLKEFGPNAEIFTFNQNGEASKYTLEQLLPDAFGPANLGRNSPERRLKK